MPDERIVDLWEYLPPFLKQFLELDKLISAEQPEFQLLIKEQNQLYDNLFIDTANNDGLKKFENLLKLYPSPGESLELRRKNVLSKWYSSDIYTMKTLLQKLSMLQGNDNIQLEWDESDAFLLHVTTRLEEYGQVDTLYQILEAILPANISYQSTNLIEFDKEITNCIAVGLSGTFTLFLTNDFTETVDISGDAFVGMANTYTEIISSY